MVNHREEDSRRIVSAIDDENIQKQRAAPREQTQPTVFIARIRLFHGPHKVEQEQKNTPGSKRKCMQPA